MLYKLYNGPARVFKNGDPVPDLKYVGQLVMTIDPSKTNCAVVLGTPAGEVLSILEMSGNNWSAGPVEDTTEYCSEIKEFLKEYVSKAEMYRIGLEQAITKKGMNHHHSNMVLTEIRGALLNFFWESYRLTKDDVEVNNWTWKSHVLPEGYRSQNEKGSYRYFWQYLGDKSYVDYYEADVTDCLCIFKYITRQTRDTYRIACQQIEKSVNDHTIAIMPDWADQLGNRDFEYNPSFTVEQNAAYYANRTRKSGIAPIDVSRIPLETLYKYSSGFMEIPRDSIARLVVAL